MTSQYSSSTSGECVLRGDKNEVSVRGAYLAINIMKGRGKKIAAQLKIEQEAAAQLKIEQLLEKMKLLQKEKDEATSQYVPPQTRWSR